MRRSLVSFLGLTVTLIAGVGFQMDVAAQEPYKIGAVFSLSGRGTLLGNPEEKTVKMLQEDVNRRGGINGHPLEIIYCDDKSDPETAERLVESLIEEHNVIAIIGPSLSDTSLKAVPIAEGSRTPMISCAASYKVVTADRRTGEQYKWVFKTAQSDSLAAAAIFTHMRKQGINRVAILSAKTGYGESGRNELLRLAPAFGINIVASEQYGPRDTSMIAQFSSIKNLDHQAIVNWSIGVTQILVLNHWRDMGMSVTPFYQSHGFGSPRNIALAGNSGEGVFCPLGACNIAEILPENHPQKKTTMEYRKRYVGKFREPVSSFGGHAWDAFSLLMDAVRNVGPDKERIREHIEYREGFIGQHGVYNFSPIDHNGLGRESFVMVVVKDGKWALAD